jgi:NADPH:quinone reductase-like Zn-dependent oxidoreductase
MATSQERKTMRGWSQNTPGPPETVLKFSSDLPYPSKVGPTEVLVEISHAALNPGSSVFITLLPMIFRTKPSIPEMDFAGRLVSIGADVPASRDLKLGMKVFGSVPVGQYAGKLKEGDRVLVNAASGGVGSLTIQMVKHAVGANGKVVAICSGGNVEMVKGLGADEVGYCTNTKYEMD